MTTDLMADDRWIGRHGIGRFADEVLARLNGYEAVPVRSSHLSPADPIRLNLMLRRRRPHVYFSPGFNPPWCCPVPLVFCVHDLIHLRVTGESGLRRRIYYQLFVRNGCRRAHRVLTVSEHTKNEIISLLGVEPEKIIVVGNGVDDTFCMEGETCSGDRPYVLYVGNTKPHKNLPRLLHAYAASGISREIELKLTVNGKGQTADLASRLGIDDNVTFVGPVDDDRLLPLYRGALCVVCPSLYEGFGLPVLEAMACGTPVAASQATSIPEVTGDAAALFDPTDIDAIAETLRCICEDDDLRSNLRTRGLARAKLFRWEQVAKRVQAVINEAMNFEL